jgi:GH25 family lysozyme M1 (1,4-beta-N-acetylmuramidase)
MFLVRDNETSDIDFDWGADRPFDIPRLDNFPIGLDSGAKAMGDKLLGIDVSWWQGVWEWDIAEAAGAHFAFIRAGSCNNVSGVCYEDRQFENNALNAPEFMPVGFYWYFRPQHSATVQADYFANLINPEDWLLPPVMDIESTGGLTPAQVGDACAAFVARVYELTTVWPIIYTRGYFWNDHVAYRSIFDECDLWVARYTSKPKPWDNPGENPKLKPDYWNDWTFWQYSDEGDAEKYGGYGPPNGDDDVDLNWFNGDLDEFHKYLGIYQKPGLPETIGVTLDVSGVKYEGHVGRVD